MRIRMNMPLMSLAVLLLMMIKRLVFWTFPDAVQVCWSSSKSELLRALSGIMHIGLHFKTGITYRICARSVLKGSMWWWMSRTSSCYAWKDYWHRSDSILSFNTAEYGVRWEVPDAAFDLAGDRVIPVVALVCALQKSACGRSQHDGSTEQMRAKNFSPVFLQDKTGCAYGCPY